MSVKDLDRYKKNKQRSLEYITGLMKLVSDHCIDQFMHGGGWIVDVVEENDFVYLKMGKDLNISLRLKDIDIDEWLNRLNIK